LNLTDKHRREIVRANRDFRAPAVASDGIRTSSPRRLAGFLIRLAVFDIEGIIGPGGKILLACVMRARRDHDIGRVVDFDVAACSGSES
jgi:hypothetical protein